MPTTAHTLPDLTLPALDGPPCRLADLRGRIVVIDFWSAECHWSRAYDGWLEARLAEWAARGIALVVVAANANEDDALVREALAGRRLSFPIYRDPGLQLADALAATHTPHVFIYDREGRLAYRGALDDRTFRGPRVSVNYLEHALEALLGGVAPEPVETEPYGCTLVRDVA
jgi:peroxiredoxin